MRDTDPTAIDIRFDPTVQRMSGYAVHPEPDGTPFDVPYISQVDETLWQGGCANGLVLPDHIDLVISLAPWWRYRLHALADRVEIEMYDSVDEPVDRAQVVKIAETINKARALGLVVLVHCQAGLNRSGLVAATSLVLQGATPQEAVQRLREARSEAVLCNPVFHQWVLDFVPDADAA